jgi:hypothetical protein
VVWGFVGGEGAKQVARKGCGWIARLSAMVIVMVGRCEVNDGRLGCCM